LTHSNQPQALMNLIMHTVQQNSSETFSASGDWIWVKIYQN